MNTSELETLIRNILNEQLAPAKAEVQGNDIFPSVGEAIDAAYQAFLCYQQCPLKIRSAIINALHGELTPHLASLAAESTAETGIGSKGDKSLKNKAALNNTPGIEDLTTTALIDDDGMVLFEYSPFGVAGSVAPNTNPTGTIINNNIGMLAAGNSVYFNPHPGTEKVSLKLIVMVRDIAFHYCGIRNLVATVTKPTFEVTQQMMTHPEIAVPTITGGPDIVAMGMKSGKKVIGAGAGNPPCAVDETADLVEAAKDIINGASFGYNLPYVAEKGLTIIDAVAERLAQQTQSFGVMLLNNEEVGKLRVVCLPEGVANKKLVSKSPATLPETAGILVPAKVPWLLTGIIRADNPWVTSEQLIPMLPVITVSDSDSALTLALKVEEGLYHAAIMHSQSVSRLNPATHTLQTSIFAKDGPSYAGIGVGGEGFATLTIATPTDEGTTSAHTFTRFRRCMLTNGSSVR